MTTFPAPGMEWRVLTLDNATDLAAFEPLIRNFQRIAPDVTIRFRIAPFGDLTHRVALKLVGEIGFANPLAGR